MTSMCTYVSFKSLAFEVLRSSVMSVHVGLDTESISPSFGGWHISIAVFELYTRSCEE